jgi:predicted Zn-dependent peptidase
MSRIKKTTLASGIKVITEEMPDAESSTIGVWVNTGSRNETGRLNGISHFIEHLLFKGTVKRTALDISREIESVGGLLNAFTSREYTCFYAKVLNRDIARAADLLSDIFINSRFEKSEMDKERLVVLQEIKMVEDTPDDLVHDLYAQSFWKGHPLGQPILGTAETMGTLGRDDIIEYYDKHYRSNRVFISVAGGVKHSTVVSLLKNTFGKIKQTFHDTELSRPVPSPGVRLFKKDLEQVHVCLGVPVPAQTDPERYKLYLLNTILGSGMSSRLFQEIREKRGLAYSVYSYLNLYRDTGSLVVYSAASSESFSKIVRLVIREFAKLRKGVSVTELKEAKSHLKGGMLLGLENSENRMTKIARDEIYFGRIIPIKKIVNTIDRVRRKDIEEMASRLLLPERITLTALGKVKGAELPRSLAHKDPGKRARRAPARS